MPVPLQGIDNKLKSSSRVPPAVEVDEERRGRVSPFRHVIAHTANIKYATQSALSGLIGFSQCHVTSVAQGAARLHTRDAFVSQVVYKRNEIPTLRCNTSEE